MMRNATRAWCGRGRDPRHEARKHGQERAYQGIIGPPSRRSERRSRSISSGSNRTPMYWTRSAPSRSTSEVRKVVDVAAVRLPREHAVPRATSRSPPRPGEEAQPAPRAPCAARIPARPRRDHGHEPALLFSPSAPSSARSGTASPRPAMTFCGVDRIMPASRSAAQRSAPCPRGRRCASDRTGEHRRIGRSAASGRLFFDEIARHAPAPGTTSVFPRALLALIGTMMPEGSADPGQWANLPARSMPRLYPEPMLTCP